MPTISVQDSRWSEEIMRQILRAIQGVRYGSVEITIHDSRVVQIERKEKIRLDKESSSQRQLSLARHPEVNTL